MVLRMDGNMLGNVVGIGYYVLFQIIGMILGYELLSKEQKAARLLTGSVFGSILMQWMPALLSMVMGFNKSSHIAALALTFLFAGIGVISSRRYMGKKEQNSDKISVAADETDSLFKRLTREYGYLLVILPVFVFFVILLWTHSIPYAADGSIHTGQSTNGDMNMHLAFITSVAKQGIFPPEYSLLPGTKLSYPFLCDTVSSSIYLWGGSLRTAYIVPMLFAALQVFMGVMLLAKEILKSRTKAVIAWIFFFFNGGFGIYYFVKGAWSDPKIFTRIFTEFYQTPTNYVDGNIRWSNIIVDMLLPQRATLFGWAVLMPALYMLYRAIMMKKRSYFVITAVMAGCLPMIHTHSFLALGLVCAMWLIYSMRTEFNAGWKSKESKIELWMLFGFFLLMCGLDAIRRVVTVSDTVYFWIAMAGIAAVVVICLYFTVRGLREEKGRTMILNWGMLLAITLVLALPQLLEWTFQQAHGSQFVRGYFNWANLNDTYLGFYFKNIGIVWILSIVALIFTRTRNYFIVSPSFFIWFVAELLVFQPNVYDNNKLLYVGYLFLCFLSADYLVEIVKKLHSAAVRRTIYAVVMFFAGISAVLTMGREAVSDYQLYSREEVEMCKYIEKNTDPTDVILTDTRYNNGVVSLTGRNIVCGCSSFLYYHGLSYEKQEEDVKTMYQNPQDTSLFDKYHVKYIFISNSERYNYTILSEDAFLENFKEVHRVGDIVLYQRK